MEMIHKIQKLLDERHIDGWLIYDFRRSNDIGCRLLSIPQDVLLTRRFYYWIPRQGIPTRVVHHVDAAALDFLPGSKTVYRSWQELEEEIKGLIHGKKRIAMEYSPRNAIPTVSKVDAGTLEMIRGFGVEVVSSADLLQYFTSIWDEKKLQLHLDAAEVLDRSVAKAWAFIKDCLTAGHTVTEWDVQQFILKEFAAQGCTTQDPPICAVNANSANPHYSPSQEGCQKIKKGDFILIDLWCKRDLPEGVYADITRVGIADKKPQPKHEAIFQIVKRARDRGTDLVKERFAKKIPLFGWEIDQAVRQVIIEAGYGEFFTHRTGHNIDMCDHGDGANIDSLETQDNRKILPGTCFSIEPGIYLEGEFGVRLEYDVFIHWDGSIQVTGGIQEKIVSM